MEERRFGFCGYGHALRHSRYRRNTNMVDNPHLKPHDPRNIANEFIRQGVKAGSRLTPPQIQKMVYFAHGYTLGTYGTPLVDEQFEAWELGPVSPAIYYGLSYLRTKPAKEDIRIHRLDRREISHAHQQIIDYVMETCSRLSGEEMSDLTHRKGTPWYKTFHANRWVIPDSLIRTHFNSEVRRMGREDSVWQRIQSTTKEMSKRVNLALRS